MKVRELIEDLKDVDQNDEVVIMDQDETTFEIKDTGFKYGERVLYVTLPEFDQEMR